MCGTEGTNDHGPPFVWFTAAALEIRGEGSAQKVLGSHYISDFGRFKRVHVKRHLWNLKGLENQSQKEKRGRNPPVLTFRPNEQSCFLPPFFLTTLDYNFPILPSHWPCLVALYWPMRMDR